MLTIKSIGHQIEKNQVISLTEWDREVKGYAGVVEYKNEIGWCTSYVTKDELETIKEWGIWADVIPAIKYIGTF